MTKKSRPSVLKRERDAKRAEKATRKRERRERLKESGSQTPPGEDVSPTDLSAGAT